MSSTKNKNAGFISLLKSSQDLSIDIPDLAHLLGKFIARAVADKILHHSFLEHTPVVSIFLSSFSFLEKQLESDYFWDTQKSPAAEEALKVANVLIEKNNGLELDMVWGVGGGQRPVRLLSEKIHLLIQEYFSSADKAEAERCLQSLGVLHFHHELVYTLLIQTSEKKEHEVRCVVLWSWFSTDSHFKKWNLQFALALDLLKYLQASSVLTVQQLSKGLERLFSDTSDISLDIPSFHQFLERCDYSLESSTGKKMN